MRALAVAEGMADQGADGGVGQNVDYGAAYNP